MQARNLDNLNSNNATSIDGYPVINSPPPVNGDSMVFENGTITFQPTSGGGDITGIINIGSGAQIFAGTTSGVASLRTVITNDSNMTIVQNSNSISVNGPTSPTYTNITATSNIDAATATFGSVASSSGTITNLQTNNITPALGSVVNISQIQTSNIFASGEVKANTIVPNSGTSINFAGNALSQLDNLNGYGTRINIWPGLSFNNSANQSLLDTFTIGNDPSNVNHNIINISDANVSGLKSLEFSGQNASIGYPNIFRINGDGTSQMAQLPSHINATPTYYVSTDSSGNLFATPPSDINNNIYTTDGIINIGSGATRTVGLASYSSPQTLSILGGFLQNQFVAVTNPASAFAQNQTTMLTADSVGTFRGYSLTQTLNSARIKFDFGLLTSSANCINFYVTSAANNMTFNAEISMVFNQSYNQPSYTWRLNSCFSANYNQDQWIYVQPLADSGWQQQYFVDYALEYYCPSSAPNTLVLRIRQYCFETIPSGFSYPGTITVVRRENDNNTADGTYVIPGLTPYLDNTWAAIIENNSPHTFSQSFSGQGEPPIVSFNAFGQRWLNVSFTFAFVGFASGSIYDCELIFGGVTTGIILTSQTTNAGEIVYMNCTSMGFSMMQLVSVGSITTYAPFSSYFQVVLSGPLIVWGNYNYTISIDTYS